MRSEQVPVGAEAPDFALPDAAGRNHRLAELRGRPVLLVFDRGHWCAACRRQLALLRQHHGQMLAAGGAILAVATETADAARTAMAEDEYPFPLLFDPEAVVAARFGVLDPEPREGRPIARPAVFVLDAAGIVRFAHVGEHPGDRPAIGALLLAIEALTEPGR